MHVIDMDKLFFGMPIWMQPPPVGKSRRGLAENLRRLHGKPVTLVSSHAGTQGEKIAEWLKSMGVELPVAQTCEGLPTWEDVSVEIDKSSGEFIVTKRTPEGGERTTYSPTLIEPLNDLRSFNTTGASEQPSAEIDPRDAFAETKQQYKDLVYAYASLLGSIAGENSGSVNVLNTEFTGDVDVLGGKLVKGGKQIPASPEATFAYAQLKGMLLEVEDVRKSFNRMRTLAAKHATAQPGIAKELPVFESYAKTLDWIESRIKSLDNPYAPEDVVKGLEKAILSPANQQIPWVAAEHAAIVKDNPPDKMEKLISLSAKIGQAKGLLKDAAKLKDRLDKLAEADKRPAEDAIMDMIDAVASGNVGEMTRMGQEALRYFSLSSRPSATEAKNKAADDSWKDMSKEKRAELAKANRIPKYIWDTRPDEVLEALDFVIDKAFQGLDFPGAEDIKSELKTQASRGQAAFDEKRFRQVIANAQKFQSAYSALKPEVKERIGSSAKPLFERWIRGDEAGVKSVLTGQYQAEAVTGKDKDRYDYFSKWVNESQSLLNTLSQEEQGKAAAIANSKLGHYREMRKKSKDVENQLESLEKEAKTGSKRPQGAKEQNAYDANIKRMRERLKEKLAIMRKEENDFKGTISPQERAAYRQQRGEQEMKAIVARSNKQKERKTWDEAQLLAQRESAKQRPEVLPLNPQSAIVALDRALRDVVNDPKTGEPFESGTRPSQERVDWLKYMLNQAEAAGVDKAEKSIVASRRLLDKLGTEATVAALEQTPKSVAQIAEENQAVSLGEEEKVAANAEPEVKPPASPTEDKVMLATEYFKKYVAAKDELTAEAANDLQAQLHTWSTSPELDKNPALKEAYTAAQSKFDQFKAKTEAAQKAVAKPSEKKQALIEEARMVRGRQEATPPPMPGGLLAPAKAVISSAWNDEMAGNLQNQINNVNRLVALAIRSPSAYIDMVADAQELATFIERFNAQIATVPLDKRARARTLLNDARMAIASAAKVKKALAEPDVKKG